MAIKSVSDEDVYETKDYTLDTVDEKRLPDSSEEVVGDDDAGLGKENRLHRRLTARQIQVFAIGGCIGSGVFVAMGNSLNSAGPGSLFLAYIAYSLIAAMINNCEAEMTTFMPVSAAFLRHPSKWVDEAWGFMIGWNYWIYTSLGLPYAMTAVSLVLGFWRDDIPAAPVIVVCMVAYAAINILAVHYYGESEFWLSMGKIILFAIVFSFTFVTMVGGNPQHDAYGFRNWKNPGAFLPYVDSGKLGRFEGFLSAMFQAAFVVAGPDYVSMVAGEARNPRKTLKTSFKTIYARFGIIFIGSALCIGIVVPANDPKLITAISGGVSNGAASPYVIAMENMGITVLPHIVNALLVTSIFSAGNSYCYSGTRAIYGLACDGHAPAIFKRCTKAGVPLFALAATMCFSALAFMQLSKSSSTVYYIIIDITTAGGLVDYICIAWTYICFHRACKAQGIDRSTLPYKGWGQPYLAWIALVSLTCIVFCFGYMSFRPWNVKSFFSDYSLLILAPCTYTFWKVVKRTKSISPLEADLVWERPEIDAYEAALTEESPGFWLEVSQMMGFNRKKHVSEA